MQTQVVNNCHCPVMEREVRIEEIYQLEGTSTCQIDVQLISWNCMEKSKCPQTAYCPLYRKYVIKGDK